jgi:hypothetical protein
MSAAPQEAPPVTRWWRTLLVLLALPLASSAILTVVWMVGGRQPLGNTAGLDAYLGALVALSNTWLALSLLQNPSERSLVVPTPLMMWLVFLAQRDTTASWYYVVFAQFACLTLLVACWKGKRAIARVATICCGALALWLEVAAVIGT